MTRPFTYTQPNADGDLETEDSPVWMVSDGTFDYEFDDEGNRTLRTRISNAAADDHTTEYDWDYRNRLTDVTFKDNSGDVTKAVRYSYDVLDRLISKSVDTSSPFNLADAVVTYYVHDGANQVLQFVDPDGSGASDPELAHRYLHGVAMDQLLADEDALGNVRWTLADNQGTIRDIVDSDGDVLGHRQYNAFGKITDDWSASIDNYFAYTGREIDPDTGLQNNRARWYDPATGTWLSPDPIGFTAGDSNLSRYVNNNPTNAIDPSGLEETEVAAEGRVKGAAIKRSIKKREGALTEVDVTRNYGKGPQDGRVDVGTGGSRDVPAEIGPASPTGVAAKNRQADAITEETPANRILYKQKGKPPKARTKFPAAELTPEAGRQLEQEAKDKKLTRGQIYKRAKELGTERTYTVSAADAKEAGRKYYRGKKLLWVKALPPKPGNDHQAKSLRL